MKFTDSSTMLSKGAETRLGPNSDQALWWTVRRGPFAETDAGIGMAVNQRRGDLDGQIDMSDHEGGADAEKLAAVREVSVGLRIEIAGPLRGRAA